MAIDLFEEGACHLSKERLDDVQQEPCVGVGTYLKRLGRVARKVRVSLEMCEE